MQNRAAQAQVESVCLLISWRIIAALKFSHCEVSASLANREQLAFLCTVSSKMFVLQAALEDSDRGQVYLLPKIDSIFLQARRRQDH